MSLRSYLKQSVSSYLFLFGAYFSNPVVYSAQAGMWMCCSTARTATSRGAAGFLPMLVMHCWCPSFAARLQVPPVVVMGGYSERVALLISHSLQSHVFGSWAKGRAHVIY